MMNLKRAGAAAVAVLVAGSMVACSSSGDKGANGKTIDVDGKQIEVKNYDFLAADYDELKDGGKLTLPLAELSEQGNPFHQDGTLYTSIIWSWYNPQVMLTDKDLNTVPNPDYVTDVKDEVKDGKTVVTYHINKDAKWNDGTPIDWKAFEATWQINNGKSDKYSPSSTDGYEHITSVEKGKDDKEVIVKYDRTYPWWRDVFGYIANPHLVDPEVYAKGYLKQAKPEWGAGPYKVDKIDYQSSTATFVPNEKWWGKKGKLEQVIYRAMEVPAAVNAFQSGEIDAIGATSKDNQAKLKEMKDVSWYNAMSPSTSLFMLNSKSPILSDAKVREAVFTAIDRKTLSKVRYQGVMMPDKDGKLTQPYAEPNPGSLIFFPSQKQYEDNFAAAIKYDQKQANQLLDEAGWKKGDDGIRTKDGKRLELRYPLIGESQTAETIARAVQANLKAAGIEAKIEKKPSSQFSQVYTNKEFDIFALGFSAGSPNSVPFFGQIYGSDSGLNLSGTGTKEFDKKIAELQALPTAEEQDKRANELEKEAFKLYGVMPTFNGPDITVTKKGLANYGSTGFVSTTKEMIGWKK